MSKYVTGILGIALFLTGCGPNIPSIELSEMLTIDMAKNTTNSISYVFKSDLGEKHKTRGLRHKKAGSFGEMRGRPTYIDQTFKPMFEEYMNYRFSTIEDGSELKLIVELKEYKLERPKDWKLRTKYVINGSLTYHVILKRNEEILEDKTTVAKASTSYTTKADKNIAMDYRNELTREICNVTLAHLDKLLTNQNL